MTLFLNILVTSVAVVLIGACVVVFGVGFHQVMKADI